VGFLARILVKLDFATICGVLAGSMTDPPALAFAGTITNSERPLVAYAAVYPLVMILCVFVVQILILILPAWAWRPVVAVLACPRNNAGYDLGNSALANFGESWKVEIACLMTALLQTLSLTNNLFQCALLDISS
jgi:hypothetical protein